MNGKMKSIPLYVKIIAGMVIGVLIGILAIHFGGQTLVTDWVKPFGKIFMSALKLIAMPLVLASLVMGVASLSDITKLSRIGGKTFGLYIFTTISAISIGLLTVNITQPGSYISQEVRDNIRQKYAAELDQKLGNAQENIAQKGPLSFIEEMVPENIILAAGDNKQMLQVIVFAVLLGISLIMIPKDKSQPVLAFFNGLNEAILKMVDLIMKVSPFCVSALMAGVIVDIAGDNPDAVGEILLALGMYSITVIGGILVLVLLFYPTLLLILAKRFSPLRFIRSILPAQMLAFSTSSSAATLPVTVECVEEKLKVSKEISSFVLPLGATVNMDGTSLYQAVATVFIAQAYGIDLNFTQQLTIILTATLASIGSAAVPGAGLVMLIIVLNSVGLDPAGIALVMAPDRILDMFRTVANVTSDCTVATIVATSEGEIDVVKPEPSTF